MLPKIAIIGGGTMGEAVTKGLLRKGLVDSEGLVVADVWEERCVYLETTYGIRAVMDNAVAVQGADIIFLSVKPQVMSGVLEGLRGHVKDGALVFSIAAGVPVRKIRDGIAVDAVIRAMPNTPAQIGEGITVWTAAPAVSEAQRGYAVAILEAMGEEVYVDDEHYLDMTTALSGSGPAYVCLFMEALVDAGVHLGFSRYVAEKLVYQTVIGSADYARQSGLHLAALRNQVTSPGGTTAEALYHLDKGGFRTVVSRAVWAAFVRSQELGRDD